MQKQWKVGVIGCTGMVGQRFITLLANHPWFTITALAASARSAGMPYGQAVEGRWAMKVPMPDSVKGMQVMDASQVEEIAPLVDFVFCAVNMDKAAIRAMEEAYARAEVPVVSNNSACRGLNDVPMVIPELNPEHLRVIETQRMRLGTRRGFIAVNPTARFKAMCRRCTRCGSSE